MDIHKNARLTPHGREHLAKMVLSGQTPQAASERAANGPTASTTKAWPACRTAARGPIGYVSRRHSL